MTNKEKKDNHELENLAWDVIGGGVVTYRGCEIRKIIGGYMVYGRHSVTTPNEVDRIIDLSLESLNKSIKQ